MLGIIQGLPNKDSNESELKRTMTLPKTLKHFVMSYNGSSTGGLLTTAVFLVKSLPQIDNQGRKLSM
jgi:hypothetical protein